MQTLDALTQEELERLRVLVRKEYPHDTVSEECRELVLDYIKDTTSVSSESVHFIKGLTKVAHTILKSDSDLDKLLVERLYQFNLEGVQIIETENLEATLGEKALILKSHFMAYAGDAAKKRFELAEIRGEGLDDQIEWAERWYNARVTSANITFRVKPLYSAHSFSFAGSAAKRRFELAKKRGERPDVLIRWAERWYNTEMLSVQLVCSREPMHAAYSCGFAGEAAKKRFELSKEVGEIPDVQVKWAKKAYNAYNLSADISVNINSTCAAYMHGFKGDIAWIIFEVTGDISWAEKAYYDRIASANMIIAEDPTHSIHARGFAGRAAYVLHEKTGEKEWAKRAIECYKEFLNPYYLNLDSQMAGLIYRIERELAFLEASTSCL